MKIVMFLLGSFLGIVIAGGAGYGLYLYAEKQREQEAGDQSEGEPTQAEPETLPTDELPPPSTPPSESPPAATEDVCVQAASCCRDYVTAVAGSMPGLSVETTCAAASQSGQLGPAGHAACEQMIVSWRTSLQTLSKPIPATCEPREAPPPDSPATTAAAGVCGRAEECCTAYVDAVAGSMPGVTADTACVGVRQAAQAGPAGDAACEQAIAGWRTGLTALNKPIPAVCE